MKLAQDFVDLARMQDSRFEGEELLLADLVRDVADNYWSLANERTIRIEVTDTTDYGFVIGEPDGLIRAFSNLVDNAVKFSEHSGVVSITLIRETRDGKCWIKASVADHGTGIDPEIMPRLFQRFASTVNQSGRVKGTGLGLNFVQAVVKRHGGAIEAHAVEPQGTCFTVTLPEAPDSDP
jgi:signal transduction histidine kinase